MYKTQQEFFLKPRRYGALLALSSALLSGASAAPADTLKPAKIAANKGVAPAAARLSYRLQTGNTSRYKVMGLLKGHFPPFSEPNSPPVNVRVQLTYIVTVKKQDAKGTEVEFAVEEGGLTLLKEEPGPDGKMKNPDDEFSIPLPLQQIKNALDVKVILRPDGSIAEISGGDAKSVKLDLGFELRKLFLLTMPVIFPDKALKAEEEWTFDDGLLGHKPGKIAYKGRLLAMAPEAKNLSFRIGQSGESRIDDKRNKDGQLTDKPEEAVDTTTGKAELTGALTFLGAPAAGGGADRYAGRLSEGRLVMTALLTRKRATPDPERPDAPLETTIDVKLRVFVRADNAARKPEKASSAKPVAASPAKKKVTKQP